MIRARGPPSRLSGCRSRQTPGVFRERSCPNKGRASASAGSWGETAMKLGTAIAEIMKREGIEILCGYPVNHLIEHAANANIRPIMVRQERIGVHMADAISRVTSGR